MNRIFKLKNTIQPYAWGSRTAIAELLGHPTPSDHPQAELWMGAHSKAPSKVWCQDRWQNLDLMIDQNPKAALGEEGVVRFGPHLPFLFKILAVEQPLSIQAHPSKALAREGFAREDAQGISLSAAHRNYKDDQHKPEMVCALTSFFALCGFRSAQQIAELITPVWPARYRESLSSLKSSKNEAAIREFFVYLMRLDKKRSSELLSDIASAAERLRDQHTVYDWIVRLKRYYPDDIGILSPILLHLIALKPGQALFLPAGRLHAYLKGAAIEIMANSDNVLRGGLTPKHVDVDELLRAVDFASHAPTVLTPHPLGCEHIYPDVADEFRLSALHVRSTQGFRDRNGRKGPEILLCMEGTAQCLWPGSSKGLAIRKGESVFIPAAVHNYELIGEARFYKAGVGNAMQRKPIPASPTIEV
ncbi:MAG: hypothetical protein VR64_17120 [Desulfatitalea sp. BRH_c12]|nr:MAG: hypothetical protein VR64_17120 [Desulfatitalea sp. BRH_c12]